MKTELEKREIQRLSNVEANRITRECLQIALMKLMTEKPIEKITISEIAKKAGVSRAAFYRNYDSKEEIIEDGCQTLFLKLQKSLEECRGDWKKWYLVFFETIRENKETFKIALDARIPIAPANLLNRTFPPATRPEYYLNIAKEAGFSSILSYWFAGGMKESPEEITEICFSILNRGE